MAKKHQIDVPDGLWKLAQERYGMKNPASKLRDVLYEDFIGGLPQSEIEDIKQDRPPPRKDRGYAHTARRPGICPFCHRAFPEGTSVILQERRAFHIECFNKKSDEEAD